MLAFPDLVVKALDMYKFTDIFSRFFCNYIYQIPTIITSNLEFLKHQWNS